MAEKERGEWLRLGHVEESDWTNVWDKMGSWWHRWRTWRTREDGSGVERRKWLRSESEVRLRCFKVKNIFSTKKGSGR